MSHPTPWQLELYALGEDVPEVRRHLPCAACEAGLTEITADPGPIPLAIWDAVKLPSPTSLVSGAGLGAIAASVGTALVVAGFVLGGRWAQPDGPPDEPPPPVDDRRVVVPFPGPEQTEDGGEPEPAPPVAAMPDPPEVRGGTSPIVHAGEGHAYTPVWSPDGNHLVFELNNHDDRSDLYIVGSNSPRADKVNLPGGGGPFGGSQVVVNPTWHPRGIVVFEGSNTGGQFRLYYVQPGGGAASEMINTTDVPGDLTFPVIDAKGGRMAFVASETGHGDLRVRDTSTGTVTALPETPLAEMFPIFDEDRLLFTRKQDNSEDIFAIDLSRGTETVVVSGPGDQTRPVPVQGGVAYFEQRGDAWDLTVMRDSGRRVLAKGVRLPLRARPAATPDGAWLAYGLEDPLQSGSIWLIRSDGSQLKEVPTGLAAAGEPALTGSSDDLRLAFTALPSGGADFRGLFMRDIAVP